MQRSIKEKLNDGEKPKRKRSTKQKSYADEINMGRAKVGDAIHLSGQPERKVTVTFLPSSMSYGSRKIGIAWFGPNGEYYTEEVSPNGFVK